MTLIGPERDMLAVGAVLNEQGVRVVLTAPGGQPRRCIVKIPRAMEKCAAACLIVERLNRAGLLCLGDVVTMDAKDWTCEVEVEPEKKATGRRQEAGGNGQEDEGRAA